MITLDMEIDLDVDLEADFGSLMDVPATFHVEAEKYPAEPYSWGGSRGTKLGVKATLMTLNLGGLALDREQAVKAFGADEIARAETYMQETYLSEDAA